MGFFDDIFSSLTNQQAAPQQTIIPTSDLLRQSYSMAGGLAPSVAALNTAYQPIITGNQLASENQVFGPAANQLQQNTYQSILDNLNLGNSVPSDLQDLITTNTLQQLGTSGIGSADAGKLFGARSLLSAGLDLAGQRRNEALRATGMLPSSSFQPGTVGIPDIGSIAGMIGDEQAAKDDYVNLQEDIRRKNFSSLINTGGRILGTAAGAFFGAKAGDPIGGARLGGQVGGAFLGQSGVAGVNTGGQQPSTFNSPLFGLNFSQIGGPRWGIGGGQQYIGSNGNVQTSTMAQGLATPYG